LTQIEVLTKDNRILSDAVDSLRDLTTEQGAKLSQAMRRVETCERDNATLQRFVDGLRDRVAILEGAQPEILVGAAFDSVFGKSNYTGSAASIGEKFDDGPTPGFIR
jgi:GTPase